MSAINVYGKRFNEVKEWGFWVYEIKGFGSDKKGHIYQHLVSNKFSETCKKLETIIYRDKNMEGDDKDLRTLECLRGRLVAERQTSRIAKEESERLGNKLVELENILKQEIKLRNKAEKRLKLVKKKLETLNICLVESDESSSWTIITTTSSSSSSDNTQSDFKDVTNSLVSTLHDDNASEASTPHNNDQIRSQISSEDYYVDDSLALVPVSSSESESSSKRNVVEEVEPLVHENVAQVLDSLRYIRETIHSSLEVRRMVRVGPT